MDRDEKDPYRDVLENTGIAVADMPNPFPGLRPFTIRESHLFFGREGQSDEVLLRLSENRFVGVIGPSGSGKSSFVYCGILPVLYGGFLTGISSSWKVIITKPGGDPVNNLAEALLKSSDEYAGLDNEERSIKKTIVSTLLQSNSLGLVEAIEQARDVEESNYLILVDQFEELFWYKKGSREDTLNETLTFINLLMEAINYEDKPIYVALTMRSDFIGECSQFPELTHKLNSSHYLIPQMTREQKRKAIEGPLAVNGIGASPRLMQKLLNDLGNNPDQLPILQHALMRTWEHWIKYREDDREHTIDLKHYEAIGGIEEALSLHANEAFNELTTEEQYICEIAFKRITEKHGENVGVRRPAPLKEIIAVVNAPQEEVIKVINKFREQGRSLLTPSHSVDLNPDSMIDISHESLMRIWVRLKNWVDDEAEAAQMYLRLAEAAQMYQDGKTSLWRPPDLQLGLNWLAKYKPTLAWGERYHPAFERTMGFLKYSQEEYETEQRAKEGEQRRKLTRAKVTAAILGSLMIVALLFLVYAIYQQTEAKIQEKLARTRAQEVKEQRDQARIATEEAQQQRDKAEMALKNAETQRKLAEYRTKEAKYLQSVADKQRKLAETNAKKAKQSAIEAQKSSEIANRQRTIAEQKESEAKRERYLAQSKAMALKSQELINNRELEALLAQQAYNFNRDYEGYKYDKDVYDGIFYALKNYQDSVTKSIESHKKGGARAIASVDRPDSSKVYSGGSDGSIFKWIYQEDGFWTTEELVPERERHAIFTLQVSPDGRYLAAGGLYSLRATDNHLEIYTLKDLEQKQGRPRKIQGYTSNIHDIQFTPDSKGIYTWGNSGYSIYYYRLDKKASRAKEVIASEEKISSISLNADGSKLAGVGGDGNLYIWDTRNNYAVSKTKIADQHLSAVAFAPYKNTLLIGDVTGMIRVVKNGLIERELSGHTSSIERLLFNHAGTFVASSSKDSKVRLWGFENLREQPITLDNQDWVWDLAFVLDDKEIMVGINSTKENLEDTDYSVRIWPTSVNKYKGIICDDLVKRNLTQDEWDIFVGEDLPYERTCPNLPPNNGDKK